MTHTFKLARRISRLRALRLVPVLLLAGACESTEILESPTAEDVTAPSLAISSTSTISISNLSAASGKTYRVGSLLQPATCSTSTERTSS